MAGLLHCELCAQGLVCEYGIILAMPDLSVRLRRPFTVFRHLNDFTG